MPIGKPVTKNQLVRTSWGTHAESVAQTIKNPPPIQETWVRSLGREDPLEEGTATHSCLENLMTKGAWWATVDGVAKSRNTAEQLTVPHFQLGSPGKKLGSQVSWGR